MAPVDIALPSPQLTIIIRFRTNLLPEVNSSKEPVNLQRPVDHVRLLSEQYKSHFAPVPSGARCCPLVDNIAAFAFALAVLLSRKLPTTAHPSAQQTPHDLSRNGTPEHEKGYMHTWGWRVCRQKFASPAAQSAIRPASGTPFVCFFLNSRAATVVVVIESFLQARLATGLPCI